MILKIRHFSRYSFSEPVFLEPHHLYFFPAQRSYYTIKDFQLSVRPGYEGLARRLDPENNTFHQCWFSNSCESLEVEAEIILDIHDYNPLDFLIEPAKNNYEEALTLYQKTIPLSEEVQSWISQFDFNDGNIVSTLIDVCSAIHDGWDHEIRYESDLLEPDECFTRKSGSCRDLSWFMIQVLRHAALPARFISGYSFNPELEEGHELHAWVEVWLHGAGWVGFDPSAGLLTTNKYIPIVASHDPQNTAPIQGTYRGKALSESTFEVSLEME